jgi:hypothetical protein
MAQNSAPQPPHVTSDIAAPAAGGPDRGAERAGGRPRVAHKLPEVPPLRQYVELLPWTPDFAAFGWCIATRKLLCFDRLSFRNRGRGVDHDFDKAWAFATRLGG